MQPYRNSQNVCEGGCGRPDDPDVVVGVRTHNSRIVPVFECPSNQRGLLTEVDETGRSSPQHLRPRGKNVVRVDIHAREALQGELADSSHQDDSHHPSYCRIFKQHPVQVIPIVSSYYTI